MPSWRRPAPCAAAVITAGGGGGAAGGPGLGGGRGRAPGGLPGAAWRRSLARSLLVTISAWPPSVSWQQSSSRSGSTIQREAAWSARVMGRPWNQAAGFVAAYFRPRTATCPNASADRPYVYRYRCAAI